MKALKYLLLIVFVISFSCNQREVEQTFQLITVKEGRHRSTPYDLTWNTDTNIIYEYSTNATWAYELGDVDQCGWNKLGGYSMHLLNSRKNSIMVGERYDRSGKILLSPYYHENGSTVWVNALCTELGDEESQPEWGDNVIAVEIGESFQVHWTVNEDIDYTAMTIITANGVLFFDKWWSEDFNRTREISPWFGGNRTAPHDWMIYRRLLSVE